MADETQTPEEPKKIEAILVEVDDETLQQAMAKRLAEAKITKDSWLQKYWRPSMAILYAVLMLLDYGIRPVVNQYYAKDFDLTTTVAAIKQLDPTVQAKALEVASRNEIWPPILNETVHLAFGAILTAAATTRGLEKIQRTKNGQGNV